MSVEHLDISNVSRALNHYLEPKMRALAAAQSTCAAMGQRPRHVFVLWYGYMGQSRDLDPFFPQQQRERLAEFNAFLKPHAKRHGAHLLDFVNLTINAQSMDGNHFGSDVNLVKALAILHSMRLWVAARNRTS